MYAYQTEQWHDFFLATAGAAAALTGLLFVALSLHIRYIVTDPIYRPMARGNLGALVMVLMLSLLALARQPALWLGVEVAAACLLYLVVAGGHQLYSLQRKRWRLTRSGLIRSGTGYVLTIAGVINGLGLAFGTGPGLYLLAVLILLTTLWTLWDAWNLLVGVADEEIAKSSVSEGPRG
jgi:phage shock protein PspC (stress-responsive transcriptional regulator)